MKNKKIKFKKSKIWLSSLVLTSAITPLVACSESETERWAAEKKIQEENTKKYTEYVKSIIDVDTIKANLLSNKNYLPFTGADYHFEEIVSWKKNSYLKQLNEVFGWTEENYNEMRKKIGSSHNPGLIYFVGLKYDTKVNYPNELEIVLEHAIPENAISIPITITQEEYQNSKVLWGYNPSMYRSINGGHFYISRYEISLPSRALQHAKKIWEDVQMYNRKPLVTKFKYELEQLKLDPDSFFLGKESDLNTFEFKYIGDDIPGHEGYSTYEMNYQVYNLSFEKDELLGEDAPKYIESFVRVPIYIKKE